MNSDVPTTLNERLKYTGFWPRVGASLIDSILIIIVTYPILFAIYGQSYLASTEFVSGFADFLLSWVFPLIAIICFWVYKQATPGKMAIGARIVDAKTGGKPTFRQFIIRYFGYFVATIPLGLGLMWVAWDPKKQGWHDKLAGTVVINPKTRVTQAVAFEER